MTDNLKRARSQAIGAGTSLRSERHFRPRCEPELAAEIHAILADLDDVMRRINGAIRLRNTLDVTRAREVQATRDAVERTGT